MKKWAPGPWSGPHGANDAGSGPAVEMAVRKVILDRRNWALWQDDAVCESGRDGSGGTSTPQVHASLGNVQNSEEEITEYAECEGRSATMSTAMHPES